MAKLAKKFNVASNPHRKNSRPRAAAKKGHHMAKAGMKRKAANTNTKKRSNPHPMRQAQRNPGGLAATIGSPKELFTASVAGLVSAVATRQIPQMVLGANNTGIRGIRHQLFNGARYDVGGRNIRRPAQPAAARSSVEW